MAITRQEKEKIVSAMSEIASRASAFVFADFFKLKTKDMNELRKTIKSAGGNIRILKKSLAQRSLGAVLPKEIVERPGGLAVMWFKDPEPIDGFKSIWKFSQKNEALTILGGYFGGMGALSAAQVKALAMTPDLGTLYGQLVGILAAPMRGLLWVLNAGVQRSKI